MVTPFDTMRAVLYIERRRGEKFEDAWLCALAAALADISDEERREQFLDMMLRFRGVWEGAYLDRGKTLMGPLAVTDATVGDLALVGITTAAQ